MNRLQAAGRIYLSLIAARKKFSGVRQARAAVPWKRRPPFTYTASRMNGATGQSLRNSSIFAGAFLGGDFASGGLLGVAVQDEEHLLDAAGGGDTSAVGALMGLHADRIKRMISVRIDPRLSARLDQSDVFQELQLDVIRRLPEFMAAREVPFFHWLRYLGLQKLAELTRFHMRTQARDVRREVAVANDISSLALANFLEGSVASPSAAMAQVELRLELESVIAELDEMDREILLMRHAEQLSSAEAAVELGISANTCRQRYLRALKRLRRALDARKLEWSADHV